MLGKKNLNFYLPIFILFLMVSSAFSAKFNGFGLKHYTIETEHFRINYEDGLEDMSKKVGSLLEGLYGIYA
ncbi:MAG: hypothetical protein PVI26_12340, partial [Chitinispirillia bacterium]